MAQNLGSKVAFCLGKEKFDQRPCGAWCSDLYVQWKTVHLSLGLIISLDERSLAVFWNEKSNGGQLKTLWAIRAGFPSLLVDNCYFHPICNCCLLDSLVLVSFPLCSLFCDVKCSWLTQIFKSMHFLIWFYFYPILYFPSLSLIFEKTSLHQHRRLFNQRTY